MPRLALIDIVRRNKVSPEGAERMSTMPWEQFKKSFNVWEKATSDLMQVWLESPLVLEPAGKMLTTMMKGKAASDQALRLWWGQMGLPTKHDQERTLHALNELERRLIDLEEQIEDAAEGA